MKAKQEYIDALNRMVEVYDNLDGCMSAINIFNEGVHLLEGLVNEHFEEKQETNYEHFKDEIIEDGIWNLALVNGKPKRCHNVYCKDCEFKTSRECKKKLEGWLKQPYERPTYKLTQCEYDMLDTIFEKDARFSTVYLIGELKKKGYFENIKGDSKVLVKDILANCEVIG